MNRSGTCGTHPNDVPNKDEYVVPLFVHGIHYIQSCDFITDCLLNKCCKFISKYLFCIYRTRAIKWRSRSVAAPLIIHAKSNFLPHFYVTILGVKQ